ncbi:hypothetical protein DJ030_07300 [bacterium endosymbiont of Escarpia laminata]|nr:MAG: hypothetical protein DJ030_07300 [bacterium endosymbiont of Escarpia laminata]
MNEFFRGVYDNYYVALELVGHFGADIARLSEKAQMAVVYLDRIKDFKRSIQHVLFIKLKA